MIMLDVNGAIQLIFDQLMVRGQQMETAAPG
jgi:hypothetical protein